MQRTTLALLGGGTQIAQTFLGGTTEESLYVPPKKLKKRISRRMKRSSSLKSNESDSLESSTSRDKGKSVMLTSRHVIVPPRPVTQVDFIDAVTAALTGDAIMLNKNSADDDDDAYSLSSVSTINSHVELSSPPSENPMLVSQQSIGMGHMFFYLDQKNPSGRDAVLPLMPSSMQGSLPNGLSSDNTSSPLVEKTMHAVPLDNPLEEPKPTSHDLKDIPVILESSVNNDDKSGANKASLGAPICLVENSNSSILSPQPPNVDKEIKVVDEEELTYFGRSVSSLRAIIEAKTKEADKDGLFERGCKMFQEGEELLSMGKIEEARETLQRAHSFQKRSLQLISGRMADLMHQQGLDHCDRGDKYLAIILLGVAEMIKHRPSAANIHLCAQVHRGYRRICPNEEKFVTSQREMDSYVKAMKKEAKPLSRTLHSYSKSLLIDTIPEDKSVQ
jgi:hypothetical protein